MQDRQLKLFWNSNVTCASLCVSYHLANRLKMSSQKEHLQNLCNERGYQSIWPVAPKRQ
jgi:hypothetical protein